MDSLMTPSRIAEILYQMIAFLFAISVHESAHAWTASRCGDPTAGHFYLRMLVKF